MRRKHGDTTFSLSDFATKTYTNDETANREELLKLAGTLNAMDIADELLVADDR